MLECRTELNVIQVPSKRWLVLLSIPKTSACDYFFCIIPTDKLKAFGQLHLLMQSETVNRLCIHTETVMLQGCGASQGKDLGKTCHRNRAASAPFVGFLASFISTATRLLQYSCYHCTCCFCFVSEHRPRPQRVETIGKASFLRAGGGAHVPR